MKKALGAIVIAAATGLAGCAPTLKQHRTPLETYEVPRKEPCNGCAMRIPQDLPDPAWLVARFQSIEGKNKQGASFDEITMYFEYPFFYDRKGMEPYTEMHVNVSKEPNQWPGRSIGMIKVPFQTLLWTYAKDVDNDGDLDGVIEVIKQHPDPKGFYHAQVHTYHVLDEDTGDFVLRRKYPCKSPCEYSPRLTDYIPFK